MSVAAAKPSRPRFLGYFFSAICAALLGALLFTISLFWGGMKERAALHGLKSTVAGRDFSKAGQYLLHIASDDKDDRHSLPASLPRSVSQLEYARTMLKALDHLAVGDMESAQEALRGIIEAPADGGSQNAVASVSDGNFSEASHILAQYRAAQSEFLDVRKRESEELRSRKGLLEQYTLLLNDTSALFSMSSPETDVPDDLPFFDSGVLKDLPRVSEIEGDPLNLRELKDAVEKIGGRIIFSGPSAYEDFVSKVGELRGESAKLRRNVESRTSELQSLKERRVKLNQTLSKLSSDLEVTLRGYLFSALPLGDERLLQLYSSLKERVLRDRKS